MRSSMWIRFFGKNTHGNIYHELVTTRYQSSTRKSLRLFGFCVVSWEDPSESEVQRGLEGQDRMDHNFSQLQRL